MIGLSQQLRAWTFLHLKGHMTIHLMKNSNFGDIHFITLLYSFFWRHIHIFILNKFFICVQVASISQNVLNKDYSLINPFFYFMGSPSTFPVMRLSVSVHAGKCSSKLPVFHWLSPAASREDFTSQQHRSCVLSLTRHTIFRL